MPRREQFTWIISGEGGSGKTELLKYLIENYNPQRRVLILNPKRDDNFFKMGIKEISKLTDVSTTKNRIVQYCPKKILRKDKNGKVKIESHNEMLDRVFFMINQITTKGAIQPNKRLFSGLIVIDDATTIFKYGVNDHAEDLFSAQGQKDSDIIAVFHGLSKIPIYIAGETDVFYILEQNAAKDTSSVKGKTQQIVINTQKVINFYANHLIGIVDFKDKYKTVSYNKLVLDENKRVKEIKIYDTQKTVELYLKNVKPKNAFY